MIVAELERIFEEMVERGDPTGRFDPPYTTVHVGTITGGNARNITARECRLHWEFRGVPGLDEEEIPRRLEAFVQAEVLPRLRRFGGEASVRTESEILVPGLAPDPGSAAETLAKRVTQQQRCDHGALRQRGRALPESRHTDSAVRPGRHRPSPPA